MINDDPCWCAWPDPGGVLGVTGPPPPIAQLYTNVDLYIQISFRLGGLRSVKMANSFLGGEGVSEEVETLGETPPLLNYRLSRTVENYDIFPTPSPSFWIRLWV